jgi:hypothetical protein
VVVSDVRRRFSGLFFHAVLGYRYRDRLSRWWHGDTYPPITTVVLSSRQQ